jgi:outer membrane protein assembly factor BamB
MTKPFGALVLAIALAWLTAGGAQPSVATGFPTVRLGTSVGPPTTVTKIAGRGFGPSEVVDISFDDQILSSVTTRPNGGFQLTVTIPAAALPGDHSLTATGQSSGLSATATFTVRTDWPMYGFSTTRAGANQYENVLTTSNVSTLQVAWSLGVGAAIGQPPVIAGGVLYDLSYDGVVHALNTQTGDEIWSAPISVGLAVNHLAVADGLVLVAGTATYALDAATGETVWQDDLYGGAFAGLLPVGDDLYTESGYELYKLDLRTGAVQWSSYIGYPGGPPSYADGRVFVTTELEAGVLAFDADSGRLLWGYPMFYETTTSPVVGSGLVYATSLGNLSSKGGSVDAFNEDTGELAWRFQDQGASFPSTPVLAQGHLLVTGEFSDRNVLYSLDGDTGKPEWSVDIPGYVGTLTSPVEADGVVYFGAYDQHLYALDAKNGVTLFDYAMGDYVTSPAVTDGTLYVGSFDQHLYAFRLPAMTEGDRG